MANKIKAKLALQLAEAGLSANRIEQVHRISKKSQKEVREAAAALGITYADVADLSDDEVYWRLFPDRNNHASVFVEPDWEKVHRELARVGVT
ncbi:MAG: IS21 family transposase, partial [Eggerthellaceae bacterium]|nr:IS21 family transposase [Eggerthellaceae bacterium]